MRRQDHPPKGQGIVEYTGMIVLGAIVAAALITGATQVMPVLFDALLNNNESALSDGEPTPAP